MPRQGYDAAGGASPDATEGLAPGTAAARVAMSLGRKDCQQLGQREGAHAQGLVHVVGRNPAPPRS